MNNLHKALEDLRDDVVKMIKLVKKQLKLTIEAITNHDKGVAKEIIRRELRINSIELQIDTKCENVFALYKPVAIDLRFVLAVININSNLERMADLSEGIAKYIIKLEEPFSEDFIAKSRINEALEIAALMMDDVQYGFKKEDTTCVREIFGRDEVLNEINAQISDVLESFAKKNPERIKEYLYMFSMINKLERFGDLAENIAEDIIFYIEAKVLKHNSES